MAENQRSSFRVDEEFPAELHYRGRVLPCSVVNISAGGARVISQLELGRETMAMVKIPLTGELAKMAALTTVTMHLEVLDSTLGEGGYVARMRSIDPPGSPEQETVAKLVFALQRRERAAQSGADDASPMQNTMDSHRRDRTADAPLRISRGLWSSKKRRDKED